MEDKATTLMRELGLKWLEVRAMDMLTFEGMCRSLKRVVSAEAMERAWTAMHAAQGTFEAMKEWLDKYQKVLNDDYQALPGDDFEAFMKSKYAKGI